MPATPEDIHRLFADAVNHGNIADLVDLYAPDAIVIERNGERTEGIDHIREHLEQLLAMRPRVTIQGSKAFTRGELALLSSHWVAEANTAQGGPVRMDFHGSELAQRQPDGEWRLVLDNPWGAG